MATRNTSNKGELKMNTTYNAAQHAYSLALNWAFYRKHLSLGEAQRHAKAAYDYEIAVSKLVEQGLSRSDAQGVVDAQQSI
jgi:hypothetical protein